MAGPNMKNKRAATPVAPQGKAKPASEKQGSAEKVAEQARSEQAPMSSKAPETAPVPLKAAEIRAPAATSARAAVEPQVANPAASRAPGPSASPAPSQVPSATASRTQSPPASAASSQVPSSAASRTQSPPASAAPSRPAGQTGPAPRASIAFAAGWRQTAEGELVAGGQVTIAYDPERAQVRPASNGTPTWGVQGFVRLLPSGQILEQPVIEVAHREAKKRPFTVDLPRGTTEIEVWFKNWSKVEPKEEWDSNFGKNYRFAVRA